MKSKSIGKVLYSNEHGEYRCGDPIWAMISGSNGAKLYQGIFIGMECGRARVYVYDSKTERTRRTLLQSNKITPR